MGPTTYIHDSYHKTKTLTIENDASPLRWMIPILPWCTLGTHYHTSLSPIRRGFAPGFLNYKKGCTLLTTASDKVYQLLAHGRWFSSGTTASSTSKIGRHDIAEILLKVALKHQKSNTFYPLSSLILTFKGSVASYQGNTITCFNIDMYFRIMLFLWTRNVWSVPTKSIKVSLNLQISSVLLKKFTE